MPASCLSQGDLQPITWPLASHWHPGGCWGGWIWFTQRSSPSMVEFTARCHCGTSCSCPSFQKYNLLLVFYCRLFNPQASLHLTLKKKFSWIDPWGSKAETGIWSMGRAVRQFRGWEPSTEHRHVWGCSMLQYSVQFCCWFKCLFWCFIISNNFWATRINNIPLLLHLLLSIDCTVFSLPKICAFLNKVFLQCLCI